MASAPFIIIAIDGGAASGKSSSSRTLSDQFDLLHVDTGSYYRALTAELLRRGIRPDDLPALRTALAGLKLGTRLNGRSAEMEIDGRVAGDEIRSREVNDAVSHFAAIPELRAALLTYQRGLADVGRAKGFRGLVMEGRDIGSAIFPGRISGFSSTPTPGSANAAAPARGCTTRSASATASTPRARPRRLPAPSARPQSTPPRSPSTRW